MSETLSALRSAVADGLAAVESALSGLLGRPVRASLLDVSESDLADVDPSWLIGHEVAVALYQYFDGSMTGHCLVMMDPSAAADLARELWGAGRPARPAHPSQWDERHRSALMEFGTILAGRFLSGMADHLAVEVLPTPPAAAVDTAEVLFNSLVAVGAEQTRRIIIVAAAFTVEGLKIPVTLALVPTHLPDQAVAPGGGHP